MKVSVVVPVYNPGRDIDRCIRSMLEQSLPSDEFEVIFVDDGSTDETPARLDALAAEHRHFRVVHIPNSGWAGRPRNVGVAHARGEYVQFVDQDDHLGREALERLYEMGSRNEADIAIGKVTSDFRIVPQVIFQRDRDNCTIRDAPLIESLTPHKMFRTAFLREHGLAFPEGRYILEDQLFMVRAYVRAGRAAILASYPCYFYNKRSDGTNAASVRMDPEEYYRNLRQIIGEMIAGIEPGDLRTRFLRRFYRVEMLWWLSEHWYLEHEAEFQELLFEVERALALDVITDEVHDGLLAVLRIRSTMLRDGRQQDLLELARRCRSIALHLRLNDAHWSAGRLEIAYTARFERTDGGGPVVLLRRGDRYFLDPRLADETVGEPVDVTDELDSFRVELSARERSSGVQWPVRSPIRLELLGDDDGGDGRVVPTVQGKASIDPPRAALGGALVRGAWELRLRLTGLGLDFRAPLGQPRDAAVNAACLPALLGDPAVLVVPHLDDDGGLALDVDRHSRTLSGALAGRRILFLRDGRRLCARLPVVASDQVGPIVVSLVLRSPSVEARLRGRLEAQNGTAVLVANAGRDVAGIPRGSYDLAARLDGEAGPAVPLGTVQVQRFGRMVVQRDRRIGTLGRATWAVRGWGRQAYLRLPPSVQRAVRVARRIAR